MKNLLLLTGELIQHQKRKVDKPFYGNPIEHQRSHIDKTVTEKNLGRTLICHRISPTSEYSYTRDTEKSLENESVGLLLFIEDTVENVFECQKDIL